MPRSPSIVPDDTNRDVYLVLDDFGRLGRAWSETDEAGTSRATLVRNLLDGHMKIRSGSSPSTPSKAGRVTRPWISQTKCADATLSTTRYRNRFSSSWKRPIGTEGCGLNSRFAVAKAERYGIHHCKRYSLAFVLGFGCI